MQGQLKPLTHLREAVVPQLEKACVLQQTAAMPQQRPNAAKKKKKTLSNIRK